MLLDDLLLVDNRLGESDLSAVREFCEEHHIALARTFPGNSKSNGNIENNFSIFERFVGDIVIKGSTANEIAESLARVIIEIFTQQRNHTPRERLGSRSPADYPTPGRAPEYVRNDIERLSLRLNRETREIEAKWNLIQSARACFEEQSLLTQEKLMKQLARYTKDDILSAQSAYLAQIAKHPDNTYRSEYFMAIVRNKREEIAKRTYNEAWRAGAARARELMPSPKPLPPKERAKDILEIFVDMLDLPSPSEWMMELDALAWWFIHYSRQASLPELWTAVENEVVMSKLMSLEQWQEIKDYLARKLGDFLYEPTVTASPTQEEQKKKPSDTSSHSISLDRKGARKDRGKSAGHSQTPMDG